MYGPASRSGKRRERTNPSVTAGLPVRSEAGLLHGIGGGLHVTVPRVLFVCPYLKSSAAYYGVIYKRFKKVFRKVPHWRSS